MDLSKKEELMLAIKAATLRKDVIKMLANAGSGHPGGSLSVLDILVVLYYKIMNISPESFKKEERDRLILSKGHSCPALYSVLADLGFIDQQCIYSLRTLGSCLQGHPDKNRTLGIEISTGSLGQGLSMAQGKALALRLKGLDKSRVYCILGDGEMQEGQVWEAIMGISHHKLNNLIAIVDNNNMQVDGYIEDIKSIYPIDEKVKACGWSVQVIDGHSYYDIHNALKRAGSSVDKPSFIIARTTKGKGISFMENNLKFHGIAPARDEEELAIKELDSHIIQIEKELENHND